MMMSNLSTSEPWSLHPQLASDTIAIGDLALSRLLVVNDANWPWLLLVPRRPEVSDIIDLDEVERAQLMTEIARVAAQGAHFVCLPETYPGPWRMPATFDPTAAMVEAAARLGVHVIFGTIEPIDVEAATAYN